MSNSSLGSEEGETGRGPHSGWAVVFLPSCAEPFSFRFLDSRSPRGPKENKRARWTRNVENPGKKPASSPWLLRRLVAPLLSFSPPRRTVPPPPTCFLFCRSRCSSSQFSPAPMIGACSTFLGHTAPPSIHGFAASLELLPYRGNFLF